jgi:hypothetical protein
MTAAWHCGMVAWRNFRSRARPPLPTQTSWRAVCWTASSGTNNVSACKLGVNRCTLLHQQHGSGHALQYTTTRNTRCYHMQVSRVFHQQRCIQYKVGESSCQGLSVMHAASRTLHSAGGMHQTLNNGSQ